ncbi:MAG: recombinase family protein [Lachnospiraceae bacterium]|nr:recombinase family protein [Lachnospiraceae bacterium]
MDGSKELSVAGSPENANAGIAEGEVQGNVLRRHITENPKKKKLSKHRLWMDSIQHEYPTPYVPFKIGVYIRYFNQTKHKNYLEKHIQEFTEDIALCKRWTLVDFYIDKGMTAPHMEYSKEWCRLLADCFSGKVDLIVTQKVSNVSSDPQEMAFIARILAAQEHPVGIYFISEDIFTLASYYREDMLDRGMFPPGWRPLPDDGENETMMLGEPEFFLLPEETVTDNYASDENGPNDGESSGATDDDAGDSADDNTKGNAGGDDLSGAEDYPEGFQLKLNLVVDSADA